MLLIDDALNAAELPRGVIATIGNYDGIHLGQQSVLELVRARADETGLLAAAITFDPHPRTVLRPEAPVELLTTRQQKEAQLDRAGMDVVLVVRFTPEFSRTHARSFVRDFLHGRLEVKEIYVGSRFAFGHQRSGDLSLLRQMGESFGFSAFAVDEVGRGGEAVSSTRIRKALRDGCAEEAAALLGRPYSLSGIITKGAGKGRQLGWPTANLASENQLIPRNGVYICRVEFGSIGGSFDAVTNIGTRPTLYETYNRVIESHLLDFDSDVYGERAEVSFLKRLRDEIAFDGPEELSQQIARDVEEAHEYLAAQSQVTEVSIKN